MKMASYEDIKNLIDIVERVTGKKNPMVGEVVVMVVRSTTDGKVQPDNCLKMLAGIIGVLGIPEEILAMPARKYLDMQESMMGMLAAIELKQTGETIQ